MTRCPSDLELEQLLLDCGAPPPALTAHLAGCGRCAGRLAAMEREGEEFLREVFPATAAAVLRRARPPAARPLRRWALALAPLAAAAAAVVIAVGRPPADYVGAKGTPLAFAVWVQGAGEVRAVSDGEDVPASAAVRFQVHAPRACGVWILSVDSAGQVSRLYPPAGDAPGPLPDGAPIPGGARLDGRPGPERLYAVCSPRPLAYGAVEQAARAAAGGGARAVRAGRALPGLPADAAQATLLLEKRP